LFRSFRFIGADVCDGARMISKNWQFFSRWCIEKVCYAAITLAAAITCMLRHETRHKRNKNNKSVKNVLATKQSGKGDNGISYQIWLGIWITEMYYRAYEKHTKILCHKSRDKLHFCLIIWWVFTCVYKLKLLKCICIILRYIILCFRRFFSHLHLIY